MPPAIQQLADRLVQHLAKIGIGAEAIYGIKSQGARERTLENFLSGRAGAEGLALAFCDSSKRGFIKAIERLIE